MNRTLCQGYILFMTLSLIAIVSMLLLSCMQHLLLYYKAINKQEFFQQEFYQLEQMAMQLIHGPVDLQCVRHQDEANQSVNFVKTDKACVLNVENNIYRYLVEDMGIQPCWVTNKKGTIYSATRLRLTISKVVSSTENLVFLQVGYIKSATLASNLDHKQNVDEGVTSWRFTTD